MTGDRDPFDLLPRFVDPEPDPAIMNATIAQSREAFANQHARQKPGSWSHWLRNSAAWLAPAGVAAAALTVAIIVAPNLTGIVPSTTANREVVADRPTDMPTAQSPTQGTRMGMQPGGQAPTASPPMLISSFEGTNVRIGSRLSRMGLELYLPDISGEETIDIQGIIAGEQLEILAAFQIPDRNIVAIRLRVDHTRFWRIYRPVDGKYARDTGLSELVTDAADQAEVERRLAAAD